MDTDFPAAHSMDTTWYAIDRDGHVAVFNSGEAGAVPADLSEGQNVHGLETLPASDALLDLAGRKLPGPLGGAEARHWSDLDRQGDYFPPALLFLRSIEPVRAALSSGLVRQRPAVAGVIAIIADSRARALVAQLHRDQQCLGCFFHWQEELAELQEGDESEPMPVDAGTRGLFVYGHLCENWISGPYGRESVPVQPVHVDQFPPLVRRRVGHLKLDLSFRDTVHIQPVEHDDCVSWESAYISSDGKKIGPLRGNRMLGDADAYSEQYESLRQEFGERLEIEPPS